MRVRIPPSAPKNVVMELKMNAGDEIAAALVTSLHLTLHLKSRAWNGIRDLYEVTAHRRDYVRR